MRKFIGIMVCIKGFLWSIIFWGRYKLCEKFKINSKWKRGVDQQFNEACEFLKEVYDDKEMRTIKKPTMDRVTTRW